MAYDVVDGSADRFRETAVIQWGRYGLLLVDNVVMADTVQFIGGNAGNDPGADHAKHLARQATGDPHFFHFV